MNEKHAVLKALGYFAGEPVKVLVDARVEGVLLPNHLMGKHEVLLDLGMRLQIPVTDLLATDAFGVSCTLSFGGKPHFCMIPWGSVLALTNAEQNYGRVWAPSLPPVDLDVRTKSDTRELLKGERPYLRLVRS